jgi:drug/metabolite transporter (DMT)-like permease
MESRRSSVLAFAGARPMLSAVGGALAIASSALLVRLSGVRPTTAAVFRCAYALPVLGALAAVESRRFGKRTRLEHTLAVVAGLCFAADLVLWHHSIEAVGAGLATVLGNLQVVVVGVVAWIVLGEKPQRRLFVAIPIVLCGVLLVSGAIGRGAYGDDPFLGVVFGVGTSLAYAAFILVHRRGASDLRRPAGPLFEATLVTAVAAAIFGALTRDAQFSITWPAHGWLVLLALTAQVVGWMLLSVSLPRLPAALTSVLLLIQPAGALGLGALILGEDPSATQLAGVALILGGVVTAAWGHRSTEPEGPELFQAPPAPVART